MMKITFVTNLYGEYARGGAERIVAREAEALAKLGHDVAVVSGERKRAVPEGVCLPGEPWLCPPAGAAEDVAAAYAAAVKRETASGEPRVIRYYPPNIYFYSEDHRHGFPSRFVWHLFDIFNRKSAATLAEILDCEKPDIVHTHNLMGLGFMIPRMLRQKGIRHMHTVHDVQLLHPSGLIKNKEPGPDKRARVQVPVDEVPADSVAWWRVLRRLYIALLRRMFGSPEVVLFPSKFLMDLHDRHGFFPRSRKMILPNPAPSVALRAREAPRRLSFLFAGQLEKHKGIEFLLDAWESWTDRGGAVLGIAGAGSLETAVKERAARLPGVRFLGRLDSRGVLDACASAAFLIVPSLVIENAPTVILESFSRGTPVIAAASGGIPELVIEGETGILFAPGDKNACLDALRRARAALPRWQTFFERTNKKAASLGAESHVKRLLAAYEKAPRGSQRVASFRV